MLVHCSCCILLWDEDQCIQAKTCIVATLDVARPSLPRAIASAGIRAISGSHRISNRIPGGTRVGFFFLCFCNFLQFLKNVWTWCAVSFVISMRMAYCKKQMPQCFYWINSFIVLLAKKKLRIRYETFQTVTGSLATMQGKLNQLEWKQFFQQCTRY